MITAKQCATCLRTFNSEGDYLRDTSRWRVCSKKNLWFNCSCGSTLVLKPGTYDWYAPDRLFSRETASLFNRLSLADKIPRISSIAMEVQNLLSQPECDLDELKVLIKRDPIFAGSLIEFADRLKRSEKGHIHTIEHAITYVGKDTVARLTLASAVKNFSTTTTSFTAQSFWEDAFICGFISEQLCRELRLDLPFDEAYLGGCLANVGKLVAAMLYPREVDLLCERVNGLRSKDNWVKVEGDLLPAAHTMLGEIAASLWGLPEYIMKCCAFHHSWYLQTASLAVSRNRQVIALAGVATQLTHWIQGRPFLVNEVMIKNFQRSFQISEERIEQLMAQFSRDYTSQRKRDFAV